MAAAIEAINGLTSATEAANVLSKSASSVMEVIGKSLSILVNNFIQPFGAMLVWVLTQLLYAWIRFKEWWDGLPGWIDENVIKPIAKWIDDYIVQPFWNLVNNVKNWIDTYLVQPIKNWIAGFFLQVDILKKAWDDFWAGITWANLEKWFNDVGKMFTDWWAGVGQQWGILKGEWDRIWSSINWSWLYDISNMIYNQIYYPMSGALNGISSMISSYIYQPFSSVFNGIYSMIYNYIYYPFMSVINAISSAISSIRIPWYAEGGVVPGTGPQLAVVHGGETIIPAGRSAPSPTSSGNNVTINMYGYQDDKFIQKVKDVLRTQGTVYNL